MACRFESGSGHGSPPEAESGLIARQGALAQVLPGHLDSSALYSKIHQGDRFELEIDQPVRFDAM